MKLYGQVKGKRRHDVQPVHEQHAIGTQAIAFKNWRKQRMEIEPPEGMKICRKCLKPKPIEEFGTWKNGNELKTCAACRKKQRDGRTKAALSGLNKRSASEQGNRKTTSENG